MLEAHPDFDPHGLKHEGVDTQKSAHVNAPYVFQKFPQVVYRGSEILTVESQKELDEALTEGCSEEVPALTALFADESHSE